MAIDRAERIKAAEEKLRLQKIRLREEERRANERDRKARARKLIQAGALIEKLGLLDLETNALYGALMSLREGASNPKQVETWATHGGRAFDREAKAAALAKEPFILSFAAPLPRENTNDLRAAGLRFNKFLSHWEGLLDPAIAHELAAKFGGTARNLKAADVAA